MIEQNTNYAYKLKYMDKPSFDKVRDLSVRFYRELPQALQDELFDALNRGVDILDSEPQMTAYLFAFGKMHQAKLNHAFGKLPEEFLEQEEINIIDYGCGQALGTMCYADFLRENGYAQKLKTITLIEPSEICLKRAALHASVLFPDAEIFTVNKSFDTLANDDIVNNREIPTLHILSNILDIQNFDLKQFASLIKGQLKGYNQFVCVGPYFNHSSLDDRMEVFRTLLNGRKDFSTRLDKYELHPDKTWTAQMLCFSVGELEEEELSTEVTKEDIENGIVDEFGVVYSIDGKRLLKCKNDNLEKYVVKNGTRVIGDRAFGDLLFNNSKIKEIIVSDSVKSIGELAFMGCSNLRKVIIPNTVSNIGWRAFCGCSSLRHINIPNTITCIEIETFKGCSSLRQIVIPNSVKSIGFCAYGECSSLQYVNISDSVVSIDENAFMGCYSLEQIFVPQDSIEKFRKLLPEELWDNIIEDISTEVTEEDLKNGVEDEFGVIYSKDGKRLLKCNNKNIKSYYVRSGIQVIWYFDKMFSNTKSKIEQIKHDSVLIIGDGAFSKCESLKQVYISKSVKCIGNNAFSGCTSLQQINIPDSVSSIGNAVFYGCISLERVFISKGSEDKFKRVLPYNLLEKLNEELSTEVSMKDIESGVEDEFGVVYSNDGKRLLKCKNDDLEKYSVKNGTQIICNRSFCGSKSRLSPSESKIKKINIPDSVINIGENAFYGCSLIQRIVIPDGSKEKFKELLPKYLWDKFVEGDAAEVTWEEIRNGVEDEFGVVYSKDGKRLLRCKNNNLVEYSVKYGTRVICCRSFLVLEKRVKNIFAPPESKIKKINIPNSVIKIGDDAFSGCESLQVINIPDSVTSIENRVFARCKSLKKILVSESRVEIIKKMIPEEIWNKLCYHEKSEVNFEYEDLDDFPYFLL